MPNRVAISTLNASTIDILNTIRANASLEYQNNVPEITEANEIPKVGEILFGYPALANQFISALVNRIAYVRVKSATFNNDYAELKKGYLAYGETVEEVFVSIAKAREFSAEKAAAREFKRTLPDVRTAFHARNWKVNYPITIENEELRTAFLSMDGVQDLIARIVDSVYTAANYDEYLLFKYLLIKAISHGKMYPKAISGSDMKDAGAAYRGASNMLTFMSNKYNAAGVTTSTRKDEQYIFMSAEYNAAYDVNVLASAFNMDKAEFMGRLKLVDDWTTFDNERFAEIRANSDMIEEVTDDELALMADVTAVLVDKEWFQVYDNLAQFTEVYVSNGLYWNYTYHIWKTVSSSPFSNAIVFLKNGTTVTIPNTVTLTVTDKSVNDNVTVLTFTPEDDETYTGTEVKFVQGEQETTDGIAVHRYGAVIIPTEETPLTMTIHAKIGETDYVSATYDSTDDVYTVNDEVDASLDVGDTVLLAKTTLITEGE